MQNIFNGRYSQFFYGAEEDLEAIKNGEIFQTVDFNYYYRVVPFTTNGSHLAPINLVCIERRYSNSINAPKRYYFYELVQNPDAKIYSGDALKQKLVFDLGLWMKNIKPETKTAFSGKRFESFINAIPTEIVVDEDFCKRAKIKMKRTLCERVKKSKNVDEICSLTSLSKYAENIVDRAHKAGAEHFSASVKVAVEASEKLEEAREKAIAELTGNTGKGGKK